MSEKQESLDAPTVQSPKTPEVKKTSVPLSANEGEQRVLGFVKREECHIFQGPMPSPEALKSYCEIVPDFGERSLCLLERESEHVQKIEMRKIDLEEKEVVARIRLADRGQIFGFVVCMVGLIAGAVLLGLGHDTAGKYFSGGSLALIIAVFLGPQVLKKLTELKESKQEDE